MQNIGRIHKECAEERLKRIQVILKDVNPKQFIGTYVKLAFPADDNFEHMWVKVTGLSEDEDHDLLGMLDSDPVLATQWKCGDMVEFKMKEVEEIFED